MQQTNRLWNLPAEQCHYQTQMQLILSHTASQSSELNFKKTQVYD